MNPVVIPENLAVNLPVSQFLDIIEQNIQYSFHNGSLINSS
jgi:hypothetical protein